VNRQREEQAEAEAEVDEKADIDSVDSPICACGSSMLMTFPRTHDVLLCEREGIAAVS
jgi:predicted RNase H-like nuclease